MKTTHAAAEKWAQQLGNRNPFKLLDAVGAITRYSYDFDPGGLKGFATIMCGSLYCTINGNLSEHDIRIVAGHEAAHLILHQAEIMLSPGRVLKDFKLYDNSGRLEFEANTFLANFLMSDDQVLEAASNLGGDYFATAKELCMPPPLLSFKIYSMIRRGFDIKNPADLNSNFLADGKTY